MEEEIYGCIMGLGGRKPDCKLAIYANYFDEIQKSMVHDLGSRNGGSNRLDRIKSRCHHSHRDLCVHTDDAWWKLKKYCHQKDVDNYPDG